MRARDGNFYGATANGGAHGYGTVFKVTADGTLTSLASFNLTNGAGSYHAPLVQAGDGNFYGTTRQGGAFGKGTLFMMTLAGALTTLGSFNGTNGAEPYAGLVQGKDGDFYGTTYSGGARYSRTNAGFGTIFRLSVTARRRSKQLPAPGA